MISYFHFLYFIFFCSLSFGEIFQSIFHSLILLKIKDELNSIAFTSIIISLICSTYIIVRRFILYIRLIKLNEQILLSFYTYLYSHLLFIFISQLFELIFICTINENVYRRHVSINKDNIVFSICWSLAFCCMECRYMYQDYCYSLYENERHHSRIYPEIHNKKEIKNDTIITILYTEETNKSESQDNCTICLDNIEKGVRLKCEHIFHLDCIKKWHQESQIINCPNCRSTTIL
jgi:hypothetical protein